MAPKKISNKRAVAAPRRDVFLVDPTSVLIVGLDTDDGPTHPLWDAHAGDAVDPASVDNVKVYGVIKPVVVTKDGDRILVVDGRTRTKWCREAAKQQRKAGEIECRLPIMFRRGDDKTLHGVARSANAHGRRDSVLDLAEQARRAADLGASPTEICATFGVTEKTLREWSALSDLAAPVRAAVESGEVSATAAARLAKMSKGDQAAALAQLRAEGGKASARRVANKTRAAKGKSELDPPAKRIRSASAEMASSVTAICNDFNEDDAAYVVDLLEKLHKILTGEPLPKGDVEHAIDDEQIVAEQEAEA